MQKTTTDDQTYINPKGKSRGNPTILTYTNEMITAKNPANYAKCRIDCCSSAYDFFWSKLGHGKIEVPQTQ